MIFNLPPNQTVEQTIIMSLGRHCTKFVGRKVYIGRSQMCFKTVNSHRMIDTCVITVSGVMRQVSLRL